MSIQELLINLTTSPFQGYHAIMKSKEMPFADPMRKAMHAMCEEAALPSLAERAFPLCERQKRIGREFFCTYKTV